MTGTDIFDSLGETETAFGTVLTILVCWTIVLKLFFVFVCVFCFCFLENILHRRKTRENIFRVFSETQPNTIKYFLENMLCRNKRTLIYLKLFVRILVVKTIKILVRENPQGLLWDCKISFFSWIKLLPSYAVFIAMTGHKFIPITYALLLALTLPFIYIILGILYFILVRKINKLL